MPQRNEEILACARLKRVAPLTILTLLREQLPGECDWGDCNAEAIGFRDDPISHFYLPVCREHAGTYRKPHGRFVTFKDVVLVYEPKDDRAVAKAPHGEATHA